SIAAVALLAVLALPFGGCMLATQQDVMKLDDDLIHLRKNQADLVTKMTDLSGNLESLNSQLESSQQQMTSLAQKLDDLQADIDRRMGILSGQMSGTPASGAATTPGDAYRIAYNDYQAGKFDLAAVGFRNLLAQFPNRMSRRRRSSIWASAPLPAKTTAAPPGNTKGLISSIPKASLRPKPSTSAAWP